MKYSIVCYDEEANEADILISLPSGEFICYSHSCEFDLWKNSQHLEFGVFLAENIMISFDKKCSFQKIDKGYFSYKVTGVVKSKYSVVVDGCAFDLDSPVPGDVKCGDYVEFECCRIDL